MNCGDGRVVDVRRIFQAACSAFIQPGRGQRIRRTALASSGNGVAVSHVVALAVGSGPKFHQDRDRLLTVFQIGDRRVLVIHLRAEVSASTARTEGQWPDAFSSSR